MEYRIPIPNDYWKWSKANPHVFKEKVKGYLATNHPDLRPVRAKYPYYVVCEKKKVSDV